MKPDARNQMIQALKDFVVPVLRHHGFAGSFPHFRRRQQEHIDLFTFQFDRHGGGFIIEIGQCQPEGFTTYWGKAIPPQKVTAWDLPANQRARIQPVAGSGTGNWFRFDGAEADVITQTAKLVVPFVEQSESMFNDFKNVTKSGK